MRKCLLSCGFIVAFVASLIWITWANAYPVTVTWTANSEPDIAGYTLTHNKITTIHSVEEVCVESTCSLVVNCEEDMIHVFRLRAFDLAGQISDYSKKKAVGKFVTDPDNVSPSPPVIINLVFTNE